MADINYFNPDSYNPAGKMNVPGLAGMWAAKDRQRYESQASLQDVMHAAETEKGVKQFGEWKQEAPLRQMTREAGMEKQRALKDFGYADTLADVEKKQISNAHDYGTLDARMASTITDSAKKQHEFALEKMQQGLHLSTMMMDALGSSGPAGAAQMVQQLKQRGIDVQNDPVVNHVLSAPNPAEMQKRLKQVQNAFNMADQGYRTHLMTAASTLEGQRLRAQATVTAAGSRLPGEKEHEETIGAFRARLKEEHPDWSEARVRYEANKQYQAGKYGAQKLDDTQARENARLIREYKELLPHLREDSPHRARLEKAIKDAGATTTIRGSGTASDPYKLD